MVMLSNHLNFDHVMDEKNKKGALAEICLDEMNPQEKKKRLQTASNLNYCTTYIM